MCLKFWRTLQVFLELSWVNVLVWKGPVCVLFKTSQSILLNNWNNIVIVYDIEWKLIDEELITCDPTFPLCHRIFIEKRANEGHRIFNKVYREEGQWTSLGCIPLFPPTNIPSSKRCCAKSFVIIFACECVIVVLPNSFVSKQIWMKQIETCSTIKVKNCRSLVMEFRNQKCTKHHRKTLRIVHSRFEEEEKHPMLLICYSLL